MKVTIEGREYDAAREARVTAKLHQKNVVDLESICVLCKSAWPCPPAVTAIVVSKLLEEKNERQYSESRERT